MASQFDRRAARSGLKTDPNGNGLRPPAPQTQKPDPPHENITFYDSDQRDLDGALRRTMNFAEWLCAVNPDLADKLPACWIHHPMLVLLLNALRVSYKAYYESKNVQNQETWLLQCLFPTVSRIDEWNHEHPEVRQNPDHKHGRDAIALSKAAQRQAVYKESGYAYPDDFWNWPDRRQDSDDPEHGKAKGEPAQRLDEDEDIIQAPDPR